MREINTLWHAVQTNCIISAGLQILLASCQHVLLIWSLCSKSPPNAFISLHEACLHNFFIESRIFGSCQSRFESHLVSPCRRPCTAASLFPQFCCWLPAHHRVHVLGISPVLFYSYVPASELCFAEVIRPLMASLL